jgi:septal ring factor EnvC (AmiA/AmiB activator)
MTNEVRTTLVFLETKIVQINAQLRHIQRRLTQARVQIRQLLSSLSRSDDEAEVA